MTLPSPSGVIASARVAANNVDTYVSTNSSAANASSYTFSAQAIGVAAANRRVIVGIATRDITALPTSVTVGGTSLTLDIDETNTPVASIWSGVITTGTTANIVLTYSSAQTYAGIGVWTVYGKSAAATAESTANTATPTATITTVAGDFCVAMLAYRCTVTTPGMGWTTATERFDGPGDGAVRMFAGADRVASGTSTDMGGTITNYTVESVLVAAAYR